MRYPSVTLDVYSADFMLTNLYDMSLILRSFTGGGQVRGTASATDGIDRGRVPSETIAPDA